MKPCRHARARVRCFPPMPAVRHRIVKSDRDKSHNDALVAFATEQMKQPLAAMPLTPPRGRNIERRFDLIVLLSNT